MDMTMNPTQTYELRDDDGVENYTNDELFELISKNKSKGYIILATMPGEEDESIPISEANVGKLA